MKGLRPANHPHIRLQQYAQLWEKNPQWIQSLLQLNIPVPQNEEQSDRKILQLSKLNKEWKNKALAGVWGGTRINTLWVDACLPLLSEINQVDYFETWFLVCWRFPQNFT